jgi:hypothetical protein
MELLAYDRGWFEVKVINQVTCTQNVASGFLPLVSGNNVSLCTKLEESLVSNKRSQNSFNIKQGLAHKALGRERNTPHMRKHSAHKWWSNKELEGRKRGN